MKSTQLLKGILEGCILIILNKKDYYGYELVEKLSEYNFSVTQGTLYPLLLRLEGQNLVEAYYEESEFGPKRKYYKITENGKKEIEDFIESYKKITDTVEGVLKEYEYN